MAGKKVTKILLIILMYIMLFAVLFFGFISFVNKDTDNYILGRRAIVNQDASLEPLAKAGSIIWLKEAGPEEWANVELDDLVFFLMPKSTEYVAGYVVTSKDNNGYIRIGNYQDTYNYTVRIRSTDITEIPVAIWNIPNGITQFMLSRIGQMIECAYILFVIIMTGVLIFKGHIKP